MRRVQIKWAEFISLSLTATSYCFLFFFLVNATSYCESLKTAPTVGREPTSVWTLGFSTGVGVGSKNLELFNIWSELGLSDRTPKAISSPAATEQVVHVNSLMIDLLE